MNVKITAVVLLLCASTAAAEPLTSEGTVSPSLRFGGCGGVYFLVEPGKFWVEVEKVDLNSRNRNTHLRAILAGPDRTVIHDVYLPDDRQAPGTGPGPVQRIRLETNVETRGIYALNITVTEDRYGEEIAWGFNTNSRRFLVETSRGHRDEAHEEPLVLLSPDAAGEVCFLPEQGAFTITLSGYPESKERPVLYDSAGTQIAALALDETGISRAAIPEGQPRDNVPWRLRMPSFQGKVHIDGVTRWPDESPYPNFSLWTPRVESWFPFHENRWLITPYHKYVYAESEDAGTATFDVYNNARKERTFSLDIEFPDAPWPVDLDALQVVVPAKQTASVTVTYAVPETGDSWKCRLRVMPLDTPEVTTYATLALQRGVSSAVRPIPLPLVLKPYEHENRQFGHRPGYPLDNQVYFSGDGRPFIASASGVIRLENGAWTKTSGAVGSNNQDIPFRTSSSKVAFDRDNNVYILGRVEGATVLLYSTDGGVSFFAVPLPGTGSFDIEQFSGHNAPDGPPPLVRYTQTERDAQLKWRRVNDLDLLLPEMDDEGLISIPEPVRLSDKCIGFSAHSGIPSSVVSRDGKVHVAWGEATDPDKDVEGVPTYVVTYDRHKNTLGQPAFVGYGPPANDVHNTPCITMDSQGRLHVLVGTHGRTFKYARSLQPNDAGGGWTEAVEIAPGLRQTYVGLVCDSEDVLHLVFRLWNFDHAYFPAGHYASLAYMHKRPGEPWSEARPLVVAPFSEYSIFYHRLTIDHASRLFLSYDYWSTYWFYRNDHRGTRRALMMSSDAGSTWELARMGHFVQQP